MTSNSIPVIAIYDIGKTNKKIFLFDEAYNVVYEKSVTLPETTDEDGYPCEDIDLLTQWIRESFTIITSLKEYNIVAINFTSYGASFVYIDQYGKPLTPLYNYLKPYPKNLHNKFYSTYGGEIMFSMHTASPILDSLNSGLQLYRLKYEKKSVFDQIAYALHLPQYISYLVTGNICSDITSIGCHTNLWNFPQNNYHEWVYREGVINKLPPIFASNAVKEIQGPSKKMKAGVGLHDSSAALIPYLINFREPFILISTGTWCISFNPFNTNPLTVEELQKDCLCYMTYRGTPVKASRLFAGYEHEQQAKRIASHFNVSPGFYKTVLYNKSIASFLRSQNLPRTRQSAAAITAFPERDLASFDACEAAYHQLMLDIIEAQINSTLLVLQGTGVKRIFVDGGFGKNILYMQLLAEAFPGIEVYAASIAQSTALGTALAIHPHWNTQPATPDTIKLLYYNTSEGN